MQWSRIEPRPATLLKIGLACKVFYGEFCKIYGGFVTEH